MSINHHIKILWSSYLLFLKCKYDNIPICKKYKHHISKAITPPIEVEPSLLANTPVIYCSLYIYYILLIPLIKQFFHLLNK